MADATVYTSPGTADPRDNTTLGMGLLFKEKLVTAHGTWSEPYASSSPNSMIQGPAALGSPYIKFDHTNAAYTIVSFGSGATDVATLTGDTGPAVGSIYIRNYNSTSSDTVWWRMYVGPRGDFIFMYLFGNTWITSGLVAGIGFGVDTTDTTSFHVRGSGSTSTTSSNQFMLGCGTGGNAAGGFINVAAGASAGELQRFYIHAGGDSSGSTTGPYGNRYPGAPFALYARPFEVHESGDIGRIRSVLHGVIGWSHKNPFATKMDLSGTLPDDGQYKIVLPKGFMGNTTEKLIDIDVYANGGGEFQVGITADACMWPQ